MATAAHTAADPLGYYALLSVAPGATPDEIRRAYRREAKGWHPDNNRSPDAAERMARLNEAYEVLSDPDKRVAYDCGTSAYNEPEPPRPVVYPVTLDFGQLCSGERATETVRVANAGGPCGTVRVEPEFDSWFRLSGARGGSSADVVAELDFEAFVADGSALPPGRHHKKVTIFLDDEFAEVALDVEVAASRSTSPGVAPTGWRDDDPSAVGSSAWFTELGLHAKRIGLAVVTGIIDPVALVGIGGELGPRWLAFLSVIALALVGLMSFCGYHTRCFTRVGTTSPTVQLLSSIVFSVGKASIALAAVALMIAIVLAALVVILGLALVSAVFGAFLGAMSSE